MMSSAALGPKTKPINEPTLPNPTSTSSWVLGKDKYTPMATAGPVMAMPTMRLNKLRGLSEVIVEARLSVEGEYA